MGDNLINSVRGQLGLKVGWFGPDSMPNQGAETLAGGGIAWGTSPQEIWVVVPPRLGCGTASSNAASDGTAPVRRWYRPESDLTTVVPPKLGCGTANSNAASGGTAPVR